MYRYALSDFSFIDKDILYIDQAFLIDIFYVMFCFVSFVYHQNCKFISLQTV